jgi:hypothetical protein
MFPIYVLLSEMVKIFRKQREYFCCYGNKHESQTKAVLPNNKPTTAKSEEKCTESNSHARGRFYKKISRQQVITLRDVFIFKCFRGNSG